MLTQDQIDFYNENGFLAVENVLTDDELEALRQVTDDYVEQSRSVTESDDVFDLEPGHSPESPKLRRIKGPAAQHELYASTMRHEGALNILAQLIGPNIRAIGHKLNMKSGAFGSPVEWHQDWAFFPHTNNNVLAIGICLDDMTEANGCLMVMPGSHKGRILNHHQDGYFVGAVTEPDFDDSAAAKLEIPAGGMSIHHGRALHGSLPNTSAQSRRLLLYTYASADAWPIRGTSWEAYEKTLIRGELTNEPRVEEVPVRLPLPQPPRTGSIYETQTLLHQSTFKQTAAS